MEKNGITGIFKKGAGVESDLLENGALPRRVMTLFMLLDTSSSMSNEGNIGKVNRAVEETLQQLKDISDGNFDAEIRVAIMSFNSKCTWVTNGAVALEDVQWNDLSASGLTSMGAAFTELESKLSRSQFLASATGAYAPVLILLSDGFPTDDIEKGLQALKHNNWYKVATKVAISVDSGADDALIKFTGSSETVIRYDSDKQDLQSLLTNLAVISSKMQSRSKSADTLGAAAEKGTADQSAATQAAQAVAKKAVRAADTASESKTGWDKSGW